MMLKIDALQIAKAIAVSKEAKFPKKKYEEQGFFRHNIQSDINKYNFRNVRMSVPLDSGMITSRTSSYNVKYKEKKLFGKVVEQMVGQVNIILDSQPNSLVLFNNSKALVLMVANEDILKFDTLLGTAEDDVDMAEFIRANNIYVDDFKLII